MTSVKPDFIPPRSSRDCQSGPIPPWDFQNHFPSAADKISRKNRDNHPGIE